MAHDGKPVTYSSVYGGEDYDATRLSTGWMEPGYDDSTWQRALPAPLAEGTVLEAQTSYPLRVMQRFRPVTRRLTVTVDGSTTWGRISKESCN